MILEGIVTTQNSAGDINVAPMGPLVEPSMSTLLLRPFQTSTTFRNLRTHPFGVFHVVDDVLLLAKAAISRLTETPPTFDALTIPARVLRDCCRWYEFRVENLDERDERSRIEVRVTHAGRLRDSFGFNRAKHAVIEAAILATRLHLIPIDQITAALESLRSPVQKTAGPQEAEAFALLEDCIRSYRGDAG